MSKIVFFIEYLEKKTNIYDASFADFLLNGKIFLKRK